MASAPVDPDGAALQALRAVGLRVTIPRRAVLVWLAEHPPLHLPDAVGAAVREQLGALSAQGVDDVLAACTSAGLRRRIEPGDPARFEGRDNHHLVCRRSGRTEDVDCRAGARPCLTPGDDRGFAVGEAELVFWGVCPTCASAGRPVDGVDDEEAQQ